MAFITKSSYRHLMLREDGGPNRTFLTYLFSDHAMGIQFLKDEGLLWSKMQCNTCGRDVTWSAQPNIPEGLRWRCRRKVAGATCSESRSIKHGSWFQKSNLTSQEILLISYDIMRREHLRRGSRRKEYHLSYNSFTSSQTLTGPCAMCLPPLPAPCDAPPVVSAQTPPSPPSGTE